MYLYVYIQWFAVYSSIRRSRRSGFPSAFQKYFLTVSTAENVIHLSAPRRPCIRAFRACGIRPVVAVFAAVFSPHEMHTLNRATAGDYERVNGDNRTCEI